MRLTGVFPPLPTPFRNDGELDAGPLALLVERLNEAPLAGYVALGSNGEAPHLSAEEASTVIRTVKRWAAPGRLIVGGTGRLSTKATIEATLRAAGDGCDAALVLPPFYYRAAMTPESLRRHYETVADRSPIPLVLYNVPANTGLNLPPEVVAALSRHPRVAGIKDSSGDVGQLAELVRLTRGPKPFDVVSGSFGSTLPGLSVGATGAILAVANVAPFECATILELFSQGRVAEAREIHMRLLPLARAVTSRFGVPGLKAALDLLGRSGGVPRLPLLSLDPAGVREVERTLREAGLL